MENSKLDKLKEDIKQKQINAVKTIVRETFKRIDALEKQKNDVQNKIKILKHDLFDLKDGRLDRILERQTMDASIRELSLVIVEKNDKDNSGSPWYIPYKCTLLEEGGAVTVELNNSIVKLNAAGSYQIENDIKYL
jgi:chromosome segregation ATPase